MQLPTIHPNGTPKAMLLEPLTAASEALELAYQALKRGGPNVRDFSVEALQIATGEHMLRLRKIDLLKEEIDAMIVAIDAL